ncbi:GOLD domain protein domain-containing protein [Forsythia ovata]|uniref:GOLD domain protein domain-containing protein n=1 Tax=Forsythia ovata TaxID=205694 RepID=A0ABD1SKZ5_9LAMI
MSMVLLGRDSRLSEIGLAQGLILPYRRYESDQGNFCTCVSGNYKLIWDNSYSTFFKKVLRYKVDCIPPVVEPVPVTVPSSYTRKLHLLGLSILSYLPVDGSNRKKLLTPFEPDVVPAPLHFKGKDQLGLRPKAGLLLNASCMPSQVGTVEVCLPDPKNLGGTSLNTKLDFQQTIQKENTVKECPFDVKNVDLKMT